MSHWAEVLGAQPLQQQGPPVRVGPQQQHGAVALPALEREVLVLRLLVVGPGQLEHRALAVGRGDTGRTSEQ